MRWLDKLSEWSARGIARRTSRRHLLTGLASVLVGGAAIPLLPVARAAEGRGNAPPDPGDPTDCNYWRYCAIDGFLCSCCGGSRNACPPGTEMSPLTWIGTCKNPTDGLNYIISYNDCCGKTSCGRCICNRNESDKPTYRAQANNDTNWCLGTDSSVYHCSTAVILGVALDKS